MVDPKEPAPSVPPELVRMTSVEGIGTLLVIGGLLLGLATIASPGAWTMFLPLGAIGVLAGVIIVRLARRSAPK